MAEDNPLRITIRPLRPDNPFADLPAEEPTPRRLYSDPLQLDPYGRDLVIRTIFGEALPNDDAGRAAVANVIRNRIASGRYGGRSAEDVIFKPYAFEPWSRPDARQRMLGLSREDPHYQSIAQIVDNIFSGQAQDTTQGATHFFSPSAQRQLGRAPPSWAQGQPLASVGGHLFYAPEGTVMGAPSNPPSPAPGGAAVRASQAAASPPPAQAARANTITPGNPFAATAAPPTAAPAAPEAEKPPLIGYPAAIQTGLEQGISFGTADEIRGGRAAGATVVGNYAAGRHPILTALVGAAKLALDNYRQNPTSEAQAAYEKAVQAARDQYKLAKEQYPGTTMASEIVGGVAVPLPGGPLTGAGRSVGARILGGGLQGATAGTLTGFGSGEGNVGERAGGAAVGGAVGLGLGGIIGAAAPAVSNVVGRTVRGLIAPEGRARAEIAEAAAQAARTSPQSRVLPQNVTPETAVADILGEPGRRMARAAKNISPEAAAHLQEFTMERARAQFPRLVAFIETRLGPIGDNEIEKILLRAEAAQTNSPLYQSVMGQFSRGVSSPRLLELLQGNTAINRAGNDALERLGNRATVERRVAPGVDSLAFWDQVKREIQSQITVAQRAGNHETVNELTGLSRALINELDRLTGGSTGPYAVARETAAGYKSIERAIDDGRKFVSSNAVTPQMAANAMRGMTPEAQDAFRRAGLNELMKRLGNVNETHDLWKNLNRSPDSQAKIRLLFNGDQGLIREFEALHHTERTMEWLRNKVQGNSSTVEQLIGAGALVGSVPLGGTFYDPSTAAGQSALSGLALLGHRSANQRVAEHVARLLTSNNPAVIDQVVRAAAGNATVMNVVRQLAENVAAKSAGAQTGRAVGGN